LNAPPPAHRRSADHPAETIERRAPIPRPARRIRRTSSQAELAAAPRAKSATPKARTIARAGLPILTLDRFEQAMQIARLAVERNLPELSYRAAREALRAGPPVVPANPNAERRAAQAAQQGIDEGSKDAVSPRVVANLIELERLWERHHERPVQVYEVLSAAVLPAARPSEVFLYAPPPSPKELLRSRSAGALLAAWAVRAGKVDDLKKAIAQRQGQPLAELPAAILYAQLAMASGDTAATVAALKTLAARLKRDTLRSTAELACHAALPALVRPERELAAAALEVLDGCAKGFESAYQPEPLATLLILMARRQFQLGDVAGARKRLDTFIETMEKNAGRYGGGDYPLLLRKQQFQRVASEYARAGLWPEALAALGKFVDIPSYSGGDPPVTGALVRTLRGLASLPARERYAALRDWTMPTKDRRVVRILASVGTRDFVPKLLAGSPAEIRPDPRRSPGPASTAVSTVDALIDAARQAGTIGALADEARAAFDQKIENAEALSTLIELAKGDAAKVMPRVEARVGVLIKENREKAAEKASTSPSRSAPTASNDGVRKKPPFLWTDYMIARDLLHGSEPSIIAAGRRLAGALIDRAELGDDVAVSSGLRGILAEADARRAGAPEALTGSIPPGWHPADTTTSQDLTSDGPPTFWIAHQGHLAHPTGSATDLLLFDQPLTGSYEFSVEALAGRSTSSALACVGLSVRPSPAGGTSRISSIGPGESLEVPWRLSRPDGFNRLTVQVTPKSVRYLINGHLAYQDDDPSPTSPWLGFATDLERHSVWRRATLKGQPAIPREVRLSHGDRLEGWISSFYGETQPARRTDPYVASTSANADMGNPRPAGKRARRPRGPVDLVAYDWAASDGVIHGRRSVVDTEPVNYYDTESSGLTAEAEQSRLYYHRPLRGGDVLTYEFLYEPGQVMVHPAIDRLAFLLEPAGVKLHWMTAGADDLSGLPANNAIEEPANRRGSAPIPLKPGEWNSLKLELVADKVVIDLNGRRIYERSLEPERQRQFGLFHYKDQTEARARNFVLRGRWPERFTPDLEGHLTLTAPAPTQSEAIRRARHAIVGEGYVAIEAGSIVERGRSLEPRARYELLSAWVLPSPDHPLVRLEGDFSPSFPIAAEGRTDGVRLQSGGALRSPALDLVDTSRELGKLDELAAKIEARKPVADDETAASGRGRRAFLALIAIARGDDDAALRLIELIRPALEKLPLDEPEWSRWPELVLAERGMTRPALRSQALAIVQALAVRSEKTPSLEAGEWPPSKLWTDQVQNLRARATLRVEAEKAGTKLDRAYGTDPDVPHWARVTPTFARTRGDGQPIPQWTLRDGQLTHHPGHAIDLMELTVPLRGDFQVDCELSTGPGREIRVAYAGLALGPKPDGKHLERTQYGRPLSDVILNPPVERRGEWSSYRLIVKGGRMTAFLDGRKVHDAPAPAECDPWLALLCTAAQSGAVRKIAISGTPRIPETLNLSAAPDLSGWLIDDASRSPNGDGPGWERRGEEIVGRLVEDIPGADQESVLRYHRPMLENGRISYEFFVQPGKALVHPVVDRLVFVLESAGVRIHWLTDGAYERTGLTPDNRADEPENRRGPATLPLKPRAWNRIVLGLDGDRVTLELNGQPIYERRLEPTNQRTIGFFHYADATQARVRNVRYRGDWPRALPANLLPGG
jgi:hypothetical protein